MRSATPERERAAGAALADHHRDRRRGEHRHLQDVARERLGLAPLLGAEPGVGAGRVDEGDDGGGELGGESHQPEGLAVALGVRHAEVALQVLLGVPALLVPDHHHRVAAQTRPAADDRGIVEVEAVAVQLDEVGEDGAEIVEGVGTAGMAGDHDALDRREISVDLGPERIELALETLQLALDVDLPLVPMRFRSSIWRSSSRRGFSNSRV